MLKLIVLFISLCKTCLHTSILCDISFIILFASLYKTCELIGHILNNIKYFYFGKYIIKWLLENIRYIHMVLNYKDVNVKRKTKWLSIGLLTKGNKKKA